MVVSALLSFPIRTTTIVLDKEYPIRTTIVLDKEDKQETLIECPSFSIMKERDMCCMADR